ncbi:MAG: GrpB family protein [Vitreoscilla sp.]
MDDALEKRPPHSSPALRRAWRQALVDRLAFRDARRSDPALARRYEVLKTRLAAEHHADREAYTQVKAKFVRAVTQGMSSA